MREINLLIIILNDYFRTPKSNVHKFEEGSPILHEKHSNVVEGVGCLPDHGEQTVGIAMVNTQMFRV